MGERIMLGCLFDMETMMQENHKPRPIADYQTFSADPILEDGKYRGVVSCKFVKGPMSEPEYFEFKCPELRDTRDEASSDARALLYTLEETPPPTVAFSGLIYSLPWTEEQARAQKWLAQNDHIAAEFEKEFPGARLITNRPLGASTFRP